MATVDPNIALGYRPVQIENPINQYAALSQIQNNQQTNQLNAMKMQEMQRAFSEEEGVRNYLAKADLSTPEGRAGLNQFGKTGLGISKLLTDQQQSAATLKKTNVETTGLEYKQRIEKMNKAVTDIINLNTPKDALASIDKHLANGDIDQDKANQLKQSIAQTPNFRDWQKSTAMGILDVKQKFEVQHQEGQLKVAQGQLGVAQQNANTSAGQLNLARENQNLLYGKDIVANTVTDNAGNVTQFNRFGEVVGKPGAVGKPSATYEKTQAVQKQLAKDLTTTISELKRVTTDKGLIDQSTGSGAGRLLDIGAGFVGKTTEGAIATAKLKPIADMVLKMVPRFEGPQSDKDTASYKEAAGQLADPTVPNKIRKEAAKEIIRLMENRKNQFVTPEMASEGFPAGAPALPAGFTPDKP